MKKVIFLISLLFFILKAEIKIEKVLDTESISEYNRWVKENKSKYPELEPIYFQIKQIKDGKYQPDAPITFDPPPEHPSTDIYEIFYYNYDRILKVEQLTGYLTVRILGNGKYLGIHKNEHPYGYEYGRTITIVKDKNGDELFKVEGHYVFRHLRDDIFTMEPPDYGEIYEKVPIIDMKKGTKPLMEIYNVNPDEVSISPNGKYVTIEQQGSPAQIILLSPELKEIWRKKFNSGVTVSLSNNYVAIGDEGKIYIYNINGELLYTYDIAPGAITNPGSIFINEEILVGISPSGQKIGFFNLTKGKQILEMELPFRDMGINPLFNEFVSLFNKFVLIIGWKENNMFVLIINKEGKIIKEWNLNLPKGYKKIFEGTKAGKKIKLIEYEWEWKSKLVGDFLIITGRKNSGIHYEPAIDKFIVYKIRE